MSVKAPIEQRSPAQKGRFQDLSGQQFGDQTVLELAGFVGKYSAWKCRCKCGHIDIFRVNALKRRKTHCPKCRPSVKNDPLYFWHYHNKHRLCDAWQDFSIFQSQYNPPKNTYPIAVDPSKPLSLTNIAFVKRHMPNARHVTYRSITLPISDWATLCNISRERMRQRINRHGIERALAPYNPDLDKAALLCASTYDSLEVGPQLNSSPKKIRGNPGKYPWEKWLDGQTHNLVQGEDFTTSHRYFLENARRAAAKQGKHLMSRSSGSILHITAY